MGTSFEDLVTDSLQRRAAAVRLPAELAALARRARRQHRRRQYVLRSGLTAVTAAGLALVVPLATTAGPRQPSSTTLRTQTVADVVQHAEDSVAASGATKVEVVHGVYYGIGQHFAAPGHTVTADATTTWSYHDSQRETAYAANDRLLLDEAVAYPALSRGSGKDAVDTGVDYITRTWWRASTPSMRAVLFAPPASCRQTLPPAAVLAPLFLPGGPTSGPWLRYYLRCGLLRLAGRQRVAGVDAIKIISVGMPTPRQIIWVDPATYLPVQSLVFTTTGNRWSVLADYRWLLATPGNLHQFSEPIPAGFRLVKFTPPPVIQFIQLPRRS